MPRAVKAKVVTEHPYDGDAIETELDVLAPDDTEPTTRRVATDYWTAFNPETGLEAVWVPGEAIPEWAWPENQNIDPPETP